MSINRKKIAAGSYWVLCLLALLVDFREAKIGVTLAYYTLVLLNLLIATLTINRLFKHDTTITTDRN